MLTPQQAYLVTASFSDAVARNPRLCDGFYEALFDRAPDARALFPHDLSGQPDKLASALGYVVRSLTQPGRIAEPLREMGRRHDGYGVTAEQYALVGSVLIETLEKTLEEDWSAEQEDAWTAAYAMLVKLMLREM